ncbi:PE family protein [Mycobacterium ulcerans]|uniref:PE family protein, PE34 n=5 Tax=Mycobacterium ulcerans group TaxID=2993898 RepID=B2HLF8_MYCMM|nr:MULTISPECIES: PE family protein [Mycobacterium]EUA86594.1 hypothetical protein I551_7000 [Mycobacterium ulcerans str. Harvey]ABL06361.1 PE family protein [Mycobacterium ulcerans Agy99]ACC43690.1 PE family protein, PE34 [Mycobacterium marinum M]EPQ45123.1 PE family protein [Mycobacterium sp. 012931]MBC9860447.1 PE family protein PE34 [Mycobacterium pseudoshottsii]
MQSMSIDPVAADIGAQLAEGAFRGLQAGATAATSITSVRPAGADEVSTQAMLAFTKHAGQMLALNQAAQEELRRAGEAVNAIARMYADTDVAVARNLIDVGWRSGSALANV